MEQPLESEGITLGAQLKESKERGKDEGRIEERKNKEVRRKEERSCGGEEHMVSLQVYF